MAGGNTSIPLGEAWLPLSLVHVEYSLSQEAPEPPLSTVPHPFVK
jgi:hypothetical protein